MAGPRTLKIGFPREKTRHSGLLLAATALFFLSLMGLGTTALHIRANAEAPPEANPPVSVTARVADFSDGYTVAERFAGRLEPARETELAFERSGLVTEILYEEGDHVTADAVVARLDTDKLKREIVKRRSEPK